MRKGFLSFIFIAFTALQAQKVSITVNGLKAEKALVYSLQGEKTFFCDSISSISKDKFIYEFNCGKHHKGLYRFVFESNRWIDFIYDGKEAQLQTWANKIADSMHVSSSESNRLYYLFIKLNREYKTKSELLQLILSRYPKDDDFYNKAQVKLSQLQSSYLEFVNNTSQKNPGSFISKYIKSSQLPVINYFLSADLQLAFLKSHALDKVSFTDTELIYSDSFTSKVIEYLTYYRNPQLSKELLEKEFISAVDTLLNKAKVNQIVYQQVTEYLIDGFRKFGFEKVIDYIVENYVIKDDLCLNSKTESSIQRRIDQNKKFPIGAIVPNIILPDTAGNEVDMSKMKSGKILILFYASWCPHCKELIPQMSEFYNSSKVRDFEILAISLDNNRNEWIKFIKNNSLSWINLSNLKGWESNPALDYLIYATPTMFLVDKDKRILGKPVTFTELKEILQ